MDKLPKGTTMEIKPIKWVIKEGSFDKDGYKKALNETYLKHPHTKSTKVCLNTVKRDRNATLNKD